MSDIFLFHSAYGLRPAVRAAAGRLRGLGHRVETPDLYGGQVAGTLQEALALRDRVGRDQLLSLAQVGVASAPPGTVLAGYSMGASLALRLATQDARFSRLLLFHGLAEPPAALPARWQVQAHLAADDPWEPRAGALAWRTALEAMGAQVELHFYRGGHLFTDPDLPDHEPAAAAEAWARTERFLAS